MLHDMKYLMKFKDRNTNRYIKVYSLDGLDCFEESGGRLRSCEYLLDRSLLQYLHSEDIQIINIKKEGIDQLFENIYQEIKAGKITINFIFYNIKGIRRLLKYCGQHVYTRRNRKNRYVIHYFTHRIVKKKGKRR